MLKKYIANTPHLELFDDDAQPPDAEPAELADDEPEHDLDIAPAELAEYIQRPPAPVDLSDITERLGSDMDERWRADHQPSPVPLKDLTEQLARDMEARWQASHLPSSSALLRPQAHAHLPARDRFQVNDAEDVLLDPVVFRQARDYLKLKPTVYLFATDAHHQLPRYCTMTTYAFTLD